MKRSFIILIVALCLLAPAGVRAQPFTPELKSPNPAALTAARKMCTTLFENLKSGKTQEIADWMMSQLGYINSEAEKLTNRNNFKSKLDLVLAGPPASAYGKVDGYDLIDEAYLPGTGRYFRFVYISYHQRAPLIWECRFYVGPENQVALHYITWSEKNPFEYMSSSDMRLPAWVRE